MNNDQFDDAKQSAREIKDTIQEGAAQVSRRTRQAVDRGAEEASGAADRLKAGTETAQAKIGEMRAEAEDYLIDLYDDTVETIRERPVSSVLIAGLVGAVLALLARRAVSLVHRCWRGAAESLCCGAPCASPNRSCAAIFAWRAQRSALAAASVRGLAICAALAVVGVFIALIAGIAVAVAGLAQSGMPLGEVLAWFLVPSLGLAGIAGFGVFRGYERLTLPQTRKRVRMLLEVIDEDR